MVVHGLELRDPVHDPLRDRHARRTRGHQHELVAADPGDACRPAGRSRRARVATWRSTWSPARDPEASLSSRKPSTSNSATETSVPWRCARATSSSSTRADGPRVGEPGQRVGEGHALEPLGALGRHGRRAERGDRGRREVGDRDQQRLLGRCRPRARRSSRTSARPTQASTEPLPGDDERQVRAGHRRCRRALRRRATERARPVERRVVDRVVGVGGDVGLERRRSRRRRSRA